MPNRRLFKQRVQNRNHILSRVTRAISSDVLPERRRRTIGQAEYEVASDMRSPNSINMDSTEADETAAIIAAATTRTTSPIRMLMNPDEDQESIRRRSMRIPLDLDPPVIIDPNTTTLTNPFTHLYPTQISVDMQRVIDQAFFSTRPSQSVQMPIQGVNAKTLSELSNFDMGSIPEEFCCSLRSEIMDDPVYDPAHPQYKFERQWIERRLQEKSENPYTRTALSKTQLIPDKQLKNKIDDYVYGVIGQHNLRAGI